MKYVMPGRIWTVVLYKPVYPETGIHFWIKLGSFETVRDVIPSTMFKYQEIEGESWSKVREFARKWRHEETLM